MSFIFGFTVGVIFLVVYRNTSETACKGSGKRDKAKGEGK